MTYVRQAKIDRIKTIVKVAAAFAGILIFLLLGFIIANYVLDKEKVVNLPTKAEKEKQVNILRAVQEIKAGETADITKFEMVSVPKQLVPDGAVSTVQVLKDKRVINNLEKKEFLLQSSLSDSASWCEEGDRLMEHTFQDGVIPATVDIGSVVDIKLFKQGAEDTVVISKVTVVGKSQNTLSFYLNAVEQEFLKEANTEGQLFLVKYLVETQPASLITYYPSYSKGQASKSTAEGFASSSMIKE